MSEWKQGFLRDVAEVVMGQSPTAEFVNKEGNGIPLLNGPTEFQLIHPLPVQFTTDAKKKAKASDLLFCVRGSTTGKMNWADQDYAIGRGIAAIRHNYGEEYQHFLRAIIEVALPNLLISATGSTFPNVGREQLLNIPLLIPSKAEQKRISSILRNIENKIQLNTQTNQTLEQIAQAIYKSWFVEYEPTRAKAAVLAASGSKAEAETAAMTAISGKSAADLATLKQQHPARYQQLADLAAAFPAALVPTDDFGEIPAGWEVKQLSEQFEFIGGAQPPKSEHIYELKAGYERFIQNRDYANDNHKTYIPISKRNKRCDERDILMDKYGEAGKVRFGIKGAYNVALAKILPTNDYCREFLRQYFMQEKIQNYLSMASVASTRNSLNSSTFAGMEIVMPSAILLKLFNDKCSEYIDRHLQLKEENRVLNDLRDTLLPKLLNGELN